MSTYLLYYMKTPPPPAELHLHNNTTTTTTNNTTTITTTINNNKINNNINNNLNNDFLIVQTFPVYPCTHARTHARMHACTLRLYLPEIPKKTSYLPIILLGSRTSSGRYLHVNKSELEIIRINLVYVLELDHP